ncbi:hypothetical protein FHR32_003736 [Streptosporangium album]|uniref:Uncharacterized protein n=1 Tax=Streptosporangium album TaxID=47479 RepID=A0A7W7RY14_9ACTN|nr:hypothetical protein [Streptosporangium album]MBB4939431.1 hypothetical protein [Streptosporangium album]
MANLVERISDAFRIDYGSFSIVDVDGLSRSPAALDPEKLFSLTDEDEIWLAATANMAIARSRAGYHHRARITLELWEAEPPTKEEGGVDRRTVELFSSSGKLRPTNSVGEAGPLLDLRVPEASWLVRGHRIAKADPFADVEDFDEDDDDDLGLRMEGLEEFLFQFWPVNAREA